ncbi:MAG: hypothetical protein JW825_00320 [Candidatus Methanofastidiosa archaeon]|nr:hypothetical protein [Candidatus Methanofastidiosa archaeon]
MSLDQVLDQINEVTKKEVDMILEEGRLEAFRITENARNEAEKLREQKNRELESTLEKLKEIRLSKVRMEYKRKKLEMEREIIKKLWERVREKVSEIDDETNKRLIRRLLHIARATPVFSISSITYVDHDLVEVPTKRPFYIYSNPRDEDTIRKYSDLEYSGNIDCIGGIVAESEDRHWKINLTYDSLLEEVFENSMKKAYKNLLGE